MMVMMMIRMTGKELREEEKGLQQKEAEVIFSHDHPLLCSCAFEDLVSDLEMLIHLEFCRFQECVSSFEKHGIKMVQELDGKTAKRSPQKT